MTNKKTVLQKGDKIVLEHMDDIQPIPDSTPCTVDYIDNTGQIHVKEHRIAIAPDVDQWQVIPDETDVRVANIKCPDIANGPGCRVSVFVSGCPLHCKDCFNEAAWDYSVGDSINKQMIERILSMMDHPYIDGLTVLGGEPMAPKNVEGTSTLVLNTRLKYPKKTIWIYSGYTYDALLRRSRKEKHIKFVLDNADVLVDGPFVTEKKNITLRFRGSENQRLIDLRTTKTTGCVTLVDDATFA